MRDIDRIVLATKRALDEAKVRLVRTQMAYDKALIEQSRADDMKQLSQETDVKKIRALQKKLRGKEK